MKMLTKEEAAAQIAEFTYLVDGDTHAMCRAFAADEDAPDEPPKLPKVHADTPPMGILPLHFPPQVSQGTAFAYELVAIAPDEFDDLKRGCLSLPEGWRLGEKIEAPQMLAKAAA